MELNDKHGTPVPPFQIKVGTRLGIIADLLNTRKYSAKIAGVSVDMLSRYIKGSSKQSFEAVAKLCKTTGASMEWVWTGEGEMLLNKHQVAEDQPEYGVKERDSYLTALQVIEEVLQAQNVDIKPKKKVELVKLVAEMIEKDDENVIKPKLLQLVALAS